MTPLNDQRQCIRVPIRYRVLVLAGDKVVACPSALNISMSGILVQTNEWIPVGTECKIVLFLLKEADEAKILARGELVRNDAQGAAIRFSEILDKDSLINLERLVQYHCADPEQARKEFEDYIAEGS